MKQVIVVNEALKLPRGKLAAQVAHASVAALLSADPDKVQSWLDTGMAKIVLQVDSETELLRLHTLAQQSDLPAALIQDAGRTVLAAETTTCLGIGPDDDERVNEVTGNLSLLR